MKNKNGFAFRDMSLKIESQPAPTKAGLVQSTRRLNPSKAKYNDIQRKLSCLVLALIA